MIRSREDIIDSQMRMIQRALGYVWQNGYEHGHLDGWHQCLESKQVKYEIEKAVMAEHAKHMKMPKSCQECDFYEQGANTESFLKFPNCKFANKSPDCEPELIPLWCPIRAKENPCILCDLPDEDKSHCAGCDTRKEWDKLHSDTKL